MVCGEQACPALGREAALIRALRVLSQMVLGLLRSPTRGKPARHNKRACHNKPVCHNKPACGTHQVQSAAIARDQALQLRRQEVGIEGEGVRVF